MGDSHRGGRPSYGSWLCARDCPAAIAGGLVILGPASYMQMRRCRLDWYQQRSDLRGLDDACLKYVCFPLSLSDKVPILSTKGGLEGVSLRCSGLVIIVLEVLRVPLLHQSKL